MFSLSYKRRQQSISDEQAGESASELKLFPIRSGGSLICIALDDKDIRPRRRRKIYRPLFGKAKIRKQVDRDNFWMGCTTTYLEKVQKILDEQEVDLDEQEEQIRKQRAKVKEQGQLLQDALKYIISCGGEEIGVTRRLEKLVQIVIDNSSSFASYLVYLSIEMSIIYSYKAKELVIMIVL